MALPMIASAEKVARMSDSALSRYFEKAAVYVGDLPGIGPNYAVMFGSSTVSSDDTGELLEKLRDRARLFREKHGLKQRKVRTLTPAIKVTDR